MASRRPRSVGRAVPDAAALAVPIEENTPANTCGSHSHSSRVAGTARGRAAPRVAMSSPSGTLCSGRTSGRRGSLGGPTRSGDRALANHMRRPMLACAHLTPYHTRGTRARRRRAPPHEPGRGRDSAPCASGVAPVSVPRSSRAAADLRLDARPWSGAGSRPSRTAVPRTPLSSPVDALGTAPATPGTREVAAEERDEQREEGEVDEDAHARPGEGWQT